MFIGYWFWASFVQMKNIPSVALTILNPSGAFAASGFFQREGYLPLHATPGLGAASLVFLLAVSLLALLLGTVYLRWRAAHQ